MTSYGTLIIVVLVAVGIVSFLWQTRIGGRWGIGPIGGVNCPRCGARLPMIRRPKSASEMMWGGWTCANCGCKVDKYGKERAST
jgi:hypothetical protein